MTGGVLPAAAESCRPRRSPAGCGGVRRYELRSTRQDDHRHHDQDPSSDAARDPQPWGQHTKLPTAEDMRPKRCPKRQRGLEPSQDQEQDGGQHGGKGRAHPAMATRLAS